MNGLAGRAGWAVMMVGAITIMAGVSQLLPVWAANEPAKPSIKELLQGPKGREGTEKPVPAGKRQDVPDDPLGRQTPRSTVESFLQAADDRDYDRASKYLEFRNLSPNLDERDGPELARQLKIILDRSLWIDVELLSADPEGDRDDNLPDARDRAGRISVNGKPYDLLLQRLQEGDGAWIWKFASPTVAHIPSLYDEFGYGPLEDLLPSWVFDYDVFGVHLWQWVIVVTAWIVLYPVAKFIIWLGALLLRRFMPARADALERHFSGPLQLLIWVMLVRACSPLVGPSVALGAIMQAATVPLLAAVWLLMRAVDFLGSSAVAQLERKGLSGARVLVLLIAKLLKVVGLTGAVLLWLDNLGFKVTTLLAGLSISGVAVALASQKSLENIFGALTLFASQPVRVGDFCRFGDKVGFVEEIGLRATRLRTLERSVITVANGEFANMHLDNYSMRDRFWYHPELGLRYETTQDQIRYILIEIQKMLRAHPKVLPEPLWVRFLGFGDYSLKIGVFAYMGVTDYTESLEVAEDLNLRIMDIISAAGSDLAFPSQIEYQLPGKPVDESRVRAVEAQVKEWKAQGTLYLPNLPQEQIAKLRGSLTYPPEGAPRNAARV